MFLRLGAILSSLSQRIDRVLEATEKLSDLHPRENPPDLTHAGRETPRENEPDTRACWSKFNQDKRSFAQVLHTPRKEVRR